jgi:hypothetical protein
LKAAFACRSLAGALDVGKLMTPEQVLPEDPHSKWRRCVSVVALVAVTVFSYLRRRDTPEATPMSDPNSTRGVAAVELPPNAGDLYERALTLIQYHVELLWLIFGAFLLTETVLLAGIATILKDDPEPWLFWGAMLGLVLVLPWASSWSQNYHYYRLRMLQAKRFEPAAGTLLTEGAAFAKGACVGDLRMPWLARTLPPRRAVPFLIGAFAVVFLSLVVVHASHWQGRGPDGAGQPEPPTSNTAMEPSAPR